MKAQIWLSGNLYRIVMTPEDHNEELLLSMICDQEPHFQQNMKGEVSVLVKSLINKETKQEEAKDGSQV